MNTNASCESALFAYECFTPFHLADPAGVLFFGNVFSLAHQAFEHFVMHYLGYSWNNWFQNKEWMVPIRHAEANFLSPIEAGKDCRIEMQIVSISQCSFTVIYHFFQRDCCCKMSMVHVFCDKFTKNKIAIPEDILARFRTNAQS